MNIRISAEREIEDPRLEVAEQQPHRRGAIDPLDPRLECPLGRLLLKGRISQPEYDAGCRWRNIYHNWLHSIGAPNPFPAAIDWNGTHSSQQPLLSDLDDEKAEAIAKAFQLGERILKEQGVRVFHAVNAVAVYEEPEELGDFEFTARAARKGLAALAKFLG